MFCDTSSNLALLLIDKGGLDEAKMILESVLETYRRTIPFDHEMNGRARLHMALLLLKKGEHKSAEPFARDALGIQMKKMPPGSWRIAVSESILGESLAGQKQFDAAEKLLTDSYKQIEKSLKPDDKRRREALTRVIDMYTSWNKPALAAQYRAMAAR
jgi:tetratricopeptide (TPR) repeat protein